MKPGAGVMARQRQALDRNYLDPLVRGLADLLDEPDIWDWYAERIER